MARTILADLNGKPREEFQFVDKGQMAAIGRSRAIVEVGRLRFSGWFAWLTWLVIHIYFLTGFRNRLFVVMNWAWSYMTFRRGARLIVEREWQMEPATADGRSVSDTDVDAIAAATSSGTESIAASADKGSSP